MPTQSRRAPRWAGSLLGSTRRPTTIANTPTGTLIRNSERQSVPNGSSSIRLPATTGPSTVESPMAGPNAANALPISAGPKMSRIRPNVWGIITAAARPCRTRPPISDSDDQATEQSTEEATKPTSPAISIRLRPNASPSRPPASSPTAMARVYAAAIHSSADADSERSRWIDGAATLRIVESRMLRIIALRITVKPIHLPLLVADCSSVTTSGGPSRVCVVMPRR